MPESSWTSLENLSSPPLTSMRFCANKRMNPLDEKNKKKKKWNSILSWVRVDFRHRLLEAGLVFRGGKRGICFYVCAVTPPRRRALFAEAPEQRHAGDTKTGTRRCSSSLLTGREPLQLHEAMAGMAAPGEGIWGSCRRFAAQWGHMEEGCGVRTGAGMQERGRRRGWGCGSGIRAGWGYLGRQGLPIPQPPHRGPGFAGGHAAPAQVGLDVGLRVRDHVQPVGLGCRGQERGVRAKELS